MTEGFQQELLELLPKEAIIELFKQRIVLTEEEFAEALRGAVEEERAWVRTREAKRKRGAERASLDIRERNRAYANIYRTERYWTDDQWRESVKAAARRRYENPEVAERHRQAARQQRERQKSDLVLYRKALESKRLYRERNREEIAEKYRAGNTPERRAKKAEYARKKRASDPEYAERQRANARRYRARRKAEKEAMKNEQ